MLDHDARSYALIARVFDGQREGLSKDDILDNVTLYWLTNTAVSSARLYWESKLPFFAPKHVAIPVAVSAFPDELYQAPRSWTEQAYPRLPRTRRLYAQVRDEPNPSARPSAASNNAGGSAPPLKERGPYKGTRPPRARRVRRRCGSPPRHRGDC
jgi:hypothetical protein